MLPSPSLGPPLLSASWSPPFPCGMLEGVSRGAVGVVGVVVAGGGGVDVCGGAGVVCVVEVVCWGMVADGGGEACVVALVVAGTGVGVLVAALVLACVWVAPARCARDALRCERAAG
jgi:hypothetical protein